jgi:ABC-type spermidine/putrescine transport system permease subunit I
VPETQQQVVAPPPSRRRSRRDPEAAVESGVWYPRWYWPSFAAPATLWLLVMFVLPFYVVICVAFGTIDPIFRNPLPVYQPWWWSFQHLGEVVGNFVGSDAIYQPAMIRTLAFVFSASAICLVLGYTVAYYVAQYGGRRKGLFLVLLISPFWISYLMRIYSWQSLLTEDGFINDIATFLHLLPSRINWLDGRPITVTLGLVYGYIPYMILPLYGQLDRIDQNLLQAGRDLGANAAQTFWRVTLPLSRQAILAGLVIVTLPMFGDYYTNDLLGSPRTAMYGNLIDTAIGNPGQGPQAGVLVLLLVLLLLIPMTYYMRATRRAIGA